MENPTEFCRNCQHPLPEGAGFCPACGQKNTDGRLTFRELTDEFIGTLFNLDNRIFSTLGALAIPGRLTSNYFEGKQIRYYHPVRLFLVSAGIFTALMTLKIAKAGLENAKIGLDERKEEFQKQQQHKLLDNLSEKVSGSFNDPKVDAALDTLKASFKSIDAPAEYDINYNFKNGNLYVDTLGKKERSGTEGQDSLVLNNFFRFGRKDDIKVAIGDLMNLSENELLDRYKIEGWQHRLMFRQYVRINKGGSKFWLYSIGNTIWMMLIMMPMLALVLKLLYVRKKYFYYEHLIFSFHTHSFMFLVFALLLALDKYLPDFIISIVLLLLSIYLFLAMKRFHRQGFFKTFLKFTLANILYILILSMAGILTLMASAVFY